jgi:anti-anti-sigma regulatory factor
VEEAVYYKSEGGTIYARATGHVTALVCPPLKAAVFERLAEDPPAERVYFDLSACEYMDSTFLGLIVGTQKRFAKAVEGRPEAHRAIVLLGVNEACRGLLRTIGVLGMVELSEEEVPFPAELQRLSGEGRASARFLLDTHQDLADLSEDNRARFSTLTSVLKKALDSEARKADG